MEVFFLRHGETEWNRDKRIQGATEWTDLTDDGIRVAESTRDGMLSRGLAFDRLYSSPYRRALHTAQVIGAGLGLEPVVDVRRFVDDNIRCCFQDPPSYVAPEGAESFEAVAARVRKFLDDELAPLSGRFARVLAVAHGGILRTVLRLAAGIPLEDFWKGTQPNCCAHVIDYTDGILTLKSRALTFEH